MNLLRHLGMMLLVVQTVEGAHETGAARPPTSHSAFRRSESIVSWSEKIWDDKEKHPCDALAGTWTAVSCNTPVANYVGDVVEAVIYRSAGYWSMTQYCWVGITYATRLDWFYHTYWGELSANPAPYDLEIGYLTDELATTRTISHRVGGARYHLNGGMYVFKDGTAIIRVLDKRGSRIDCLFEKGRHPL